MNRSEREHPFCDLFEESDVICKDCALPVVSFFELAKRYDLREKEIRALRIELAEVHNSKKFPGSIERLFGIPLANYLQFLDIIRGAGYDPADVLGKQPIVGILEEKQNG